MLCLDPQLIHLFCVYSAGDMWKVKVASTGKDSYIPKTYIAKVENK